MERKNFLRGIGMVGLGSMFTFKPAITKAQGFSAMGGRSCILIPSETPGPYGLDLNSNNAMHRADIREGNAGTQLDLTLTLVNINNSCSPIANARVDIWHCNKDGYYSAFNNQPGYLGTQNHSGEIFFRGIQLSDSNGEVKFTTIYPGWYPGRVTHIHFQVFVSSVLSATSQMAFPENMNTVVNGTSLYSAHGQNPTKNTNDGVFVDSANTQYEILDITSNSSTGGYDGTLTVGLDVPVTGLINLEPETGGQFKLQQNFPNPFNETTAIPFNLTNPSKVKIEIFDMEGRKMAVPVAQNLGAGDHRIVLNRQNLAEGNYVYQFSVENTNGIFHQCKVLTVK